MKRYHLAWLMCLSLAVTVSAQDPADNTNPITEVTETYKSGGKDVTVERFAPKAEGKYPAVVVCHGSGGPGPAGSARNMQRRLAANGYVVLYPYFYERTGFVFQPGKASTSQEVRGWMQAVSDCVNHAAKLPNVDAKKIGVMGSSLGAYLALSVAGQNPQVAACVDYYGNYHDALGRDMRRTPPILILHGDADKVVPVDQARRLERFLQGRKATYEIRIYAGAEHGFSGDDAKDAVERTLAFLDKHLKKEDSGAK